MAFEPDFSQLTVLCSTHWATATADNLADGQSVRQWVRQSVDYDLPNEADGLFCRLISPILEKRVIKRARSPAGPPGRPTDRPIVRVRPQQRKWMCLRQTQKHKKRRSTTPEAYCTSMTIAAFAYNCCLMASLRHKVDLFVLVVSDGNKRHYNISSCWTALASDNYKHSHVQPLQAHTDKVLRAGEQLSAP